MHEERMIFSQFLELISWKSFQSYVDRYRGDYYVKSFYCREFFCVMIFAQITGRSSLSAIVLCLKAVSHHYIPRWHSFSVNEKQSCSRQQPKVVENISRLYQNVSQHTILLLVPNRTNVQIALLNTKCRLRLRQLDVRLP